MIISKKIDFQRHNSVPKIEEVKFSMSKNSQFFLKKIEILQTSLFFMYIFS